MKTPKPNQTTNPPRRTPTVQSIHNQTQPVQPTKNIHISINVDAMVAFFSAVGRQLRTKRVLIIGSILITLVVVLLSFGPIRQQLANTPTPTTTTQTIEDLEYQTVLPADKSIDTSDGWKRISAPGSEPVFVFAYADTIDGVSIKVSQQPLPSSFKGDTNNQVAAMAKNFNATAKLDVGQIKAYVGTSAKGPQHIIFTKNGLLVLIKSQQTINDTAWMSYIASLD